MRSWIESLRVRAKKDERGFTMLEVVLTIVIIMALMGLTASAISIAQSAQASTMTSSKNIITSNGVFEKLKKDLDSAVDIQVVGVQSLEIAQRGGYCVRWDISEKDGVEAVERYSANGPITGSSPKVTYSEALDPGVSAFTKTTKKVSLSLSYKGAKKPVIGDYALKISPDGKTGKAACGWL